MLAAMPRCRCRDFSLLVGLSAAAAVILFSETRQAIHAFPGFGRARLGQLGLRSGALKLFPSQERPVGGGAPAPAAVRGRARYLWSTPRGGGFNNQLKTVYEGVRCAQLLNRTLELPLFYSRPRKGAGGANATGPHPFADYFSLRALSAAVRHAAPAQLALHGLPCAFVVHAEKPPARRLPRLLREEYAARFGLRARYEALPSEGEACLDDSVCRKLPLTAPAELGRFSDFATAGEGYNIRQSPVLQRVRRAMRPSRTVLAVADAAAAHIGKGYNAMHVRRGDFWKKCKEMKEFCARFGSNSFFQSPEWLRKTVRGFRNHTLPVFVSTNDAVQCRRMLRGVPNRVVYMEDVPLPKELFWARDRSDIMSFASQMVSARAQEFVGNRFSSYTTTINYERFLRDMNETVVFF